AEPALAACLLDAAALVVGRPGQHVDALSARHQPLDRATVGGAALGLVPHLGAELRRPLRLAAGPDAGLGATGLALEAGIAGKQAAGGEHMTLPHQLAVDVYGAARAAGERATGRVGAGQRAAQRAAVDEPAKGRLRRRAARVAPAADAADLLVLGRLDAGQPRGGAGNTHEVPAQRLGAALQRLVAADQRQPAGDACE